MKGKTTFRSTEITQLKSLINQRVKADRSKQKGIRAKMRRIGFYGSDFGITDLQLTDFERLISSGYIQIKGQKVESVKVAESKTRVEPQEKFTEPMATNGFRLFDPQKHSSSDIPDLPGNYIVCLRKGAELPDIGIPCTMQQYSGYEVIYTGIAGGSLRKRDYRQHFTGNNAGRSTLRKSLGSMFGFNKIPRDKDPNTGKTKFNESDEARLSKWMRSHLLLFFTTNEQPELMEDKLIDLLNPPLNLSKNHNTINRDFRAELSRLR